MIALKEADACGFYAGIKSSFDPKTILIQILFETGARISEVINLSTRDLVGNQLTIKPLKGSNPRTVTISPNLVAKCSDLDGLLITAFGTVALSSRRRLLARHLGKLSMQLLETTVNPHALRHTAFTRLYKRTKDIVLVNQWAGHKSLNSTMVYVHADLKDQADKAMQAMLK